MMPLPAIVKETIHLTIWQSAPPEPVSELRFVTPRGEGMMEAFDLVHQAAAICDGCGQVLHINSRAETLLGDAYCALGRTFDFDASAPAFRETLDRALAVDGPRDLEVPLRVQGRGALLVRAVALVRQAPPMEADGAVLLLMRRKILSLDEILSVRFGLTAAEVRVVSQMAEGAAIVEIADRNGVRPATVRSQLKSIFLKTAMHRQSQLVALVARLRAEEGAVG